MQDFISFAVSHGFNISQPILDGSFQRFNRGDSKKKNGWYVGQQFVSTKGHTYICATLGDWRENLTIRYKPSVKLSREDNAAIKQQHIANMETARKEQEKQRAKAANLAQNDWDKAQKVDFDHPYLKRKLITKDVGIKQSGNAIIVPCRDLNGKMWGLQKISKDGSKLFMKGQRTKGTFHTIGNLDDSDIVYVVEGMATGASIYEATSSAVIVTFSAGNLIAVCSELKQKYSKIFIVCGDDDKQNEINTGREAAYKAAEKLGSKALFPVFADNVKNLTDFNDLHVEQGIDEVKKQLETEYEEKPFTAIGHNNGAHFFFTDKGKTIYRLTQFSEKELFELRPLEYWKTLYGDEDGKVEWAQIKSDLIEMSTTVGVFNASKIRGCGVWNDNGRIVVNTGENFAVDGEVHDDFKSNYFYIQTRQAIPPLQAPATTDELTPLLEFLSLVKFQNKADWKLVAGWLAIARIAGALPIRPHIWVTGGRGTGKSSLFEKVITPMLGKSKVYASGAGTTEAGIRQSISADSVPVIIDEFEINTKHSENIEGILGLMRQAWSAGDAKIYKGSAGGNALEYSLAFCALVASIRVGVVNDADRGRICILELINHGSVDSEWKAMECVAKKISVDLGERLFARSVSMSATILSSFETARAAVTTLASDSRTGQQYGMLIAGFHSLVSDNQITTLEAAALFSEIMTKENQSENENVRDEFELLDHILTTRVDVSIPNGDRQDMIKKETIGAMIENEIWSAQLPTYGIMVTAKELRIANSHAELEKILKDTRWHKNWGRTLGRLPGAVAKKPCGWTLKTTKKCTTIPISVLEN